MLKNKVNIERLIENIIKYQKINILSNKAIKKIFTFFNSKGTNAPMQPCRDVASNVSTCAKHYLLEMIWVVIIVYLLSVVNLNAQTVDSGTTWTCTWTLTGVAPNLTITINPINGTGAMANYGSTSNGFLDPPWVSYINSISSVLINNGVTSIGSNAFSGCTRLNVIENQATTPQTISANVFTGVNKNTCALRVPAASIAAYKEKAVWEEFGNTASIIEDIEINEQNFPDANFRQYLLEQSLNNDGKLTNVEIAGKTLISVNNMNISDLTGIHFFTELTSLYCFDNQLTSLDVSKNLVLRSLSCQNNQLTALDVSNNTALLSLYCHINQLTSLDLTGLNSLTIFNGSDQTPVLPLTGSYNNYSATINLNQPTFGQSGLSYSNGKLTSTSNTISSSSFTVETGLAGKTLSGTLSLTYPTEYGVSIGTFANGSVTADKPFAQLGEIVTLTITAATNYELETIVAYKTGESTTPVSLSGSGNTRTFTMPEYAVTVTATFKETQCSLDGKAVANAKIAIENSLFSVPQETANTEQTIKTWLATQINSLIASTGITVSQSNITLSSLTPAFGGTNGSFNFIVSFLKGCATGTASKNGTIIAAPVYTIIIEPSPNGSVSADKASTQQGETVTLTITPSACYELESIIAYKTGEQTMIVPLSGSGNTRTITMPAYAVSVRATFKKTQVCMDEEDVAAAKVAIENNSYTVAQLTANTEATVKTWLVTYINSLIATTGIAVTENNITLSPFTPASGGTNGSFNFSVSFTKGSASGTASKSGTISSAPLYNVIIGMLTNGVITADKPTAQQGETLTLTIVPAAGYELETITANKTGEQTTVVSLNGSGNTRTLIMPAYDVTITATFKKTQEQLDKEAVAAAKTAIENNTYLVEQLIANTDVTVKTWLSTQINNLIAVTGITVRENNITISYLTPASNGINGSFYFSVSLTKGSANDTAIKNGTISSSPVYTVLVGMLINGSISTDKLTAQQSETVTLTITPNTGYEPVSIIAHKIGEPSTVVSLNGTGNTRTFTMPAYDVSISATFEKTQDTMDAEAVAAAEAAITGGTYHIAQLTANDAGGVKTWLINTLNQLFGQTHGLQLRSSPIPIDALVEVTTITPAIAGTEDNPNGINGAFTFTVTLTRGTTTIVTTQTSGIILAAPYSATPLKRIELLPLNELTTRILNTGNVATGVLTLTLSGADASSFILPASTINSLPTGGEADVVLNPRDNLAEGVYNVTLIVTGDDLTPISINMIYTVSSTSIENPNVNPLRAWVQNELLHLTGLSVGESLYIYNLYGMLVYKSIVTSDEAIIPLQTQGVYIVLTGKNTLKVVYN